jgi:hypothetical protein
MPIVTDRDADTYACLDDHLAPRRLLTPYEAAYLELAQCRQVPLDALDKVSRSASGGGSLRSAQMAN